MLGGQPAEVDAFGVDAAISWSGRQIARILPWEIIQRTVVAVGHAAGVAVRDGAPLLEVVVSQVQEELRRWGATTV